MSDAARRPGGSRVLSSRSAIVRLILAALALVCGSGSLFPLAAQPAPSIGVMVDHNWIQLFDFPPESSVSVTVNDGIKGSATVSTEASVSPQLNWWEKGEANRLVAGDKITVTYGAGSTVVTFVQNVQATADAAGNLVSGSALDPLALPLLGNAVRASIHDANWNYLNMTQGATVNLGAFLIDFGSQDLQKGQKIFLTLWHASDGSEAGSWTAREVYNGIPTLGVWPAYNWVQGGNFPPESAVAVSVRHGETAKGSVQVVTDSGGNFWQDWWPQGEANRLVPGDTVVATFGQETVEMLVQNVQAAVDLSQDVVSGTARDGSTGELLTTGRAGAHIVQAPGQQEPHAWLETDVADGTFLLDFGGAWDIVRGHSIGVTYTSPEGHQTMCDVYNGIPALQAHTRQNWVQGNQLPPETAVTVSLSSRTHQAKGSIQSVTDASGSFFVEWWPQGQANRVSPGDLLTVTYGQEAVSMRVHNVQASVDLGTDVVSGTARDGLTDALLGAGKADALITLSWSQQQPHAWLETAVAAGAFALDFAGTWDIEQGHAINVSYTSPEGHATFTEAYNAIPALNAMVDHNWVEGVGFPPETSVTVTVSAGAVVRGSEQATTDPQGNFWLGWASHGEENRVRVGDLVHVAYGETSAEMVVMNVEAAADPDQDRIAGTALDGTAAPLAGRRVDVRVSAPGDWGNVLKTAEVAVGGDGSFVLDLAPFDLQPGQLIWLTLWDKDDGTAAGNQTIREVYNGVPTLTAQVDHNWIYGTGFPPDSEQTVAVSSGAGSKGSVTVQVNRSGWFWQNWNPQGEANHLAVGDTITASVGPDSVDMLVQDVQARVDVATDTISGTAFDAVSALALAGQTVRVQVAPSWDRQDQGQSRAALVREDGTFTVAFAGGWDIRRGDAVLVTHVSPAGHQTLREPSRTDISGRVTAQDSGLGMPGVLVSVLPEANTIERQAVTDAEGRYEIGTLAPGAYKLLFEAVEYNRTHSTHYQSEWHADKAGFDTADWVVVTPGDSAPTVDAALEEGGGGIEGQVTGDGDQGLPGVWICVQSAAWTEPTPNCVGLAPSGVGGLYAFTGVRPGDYKVLFAPSDYNELHGTNYALQWYAEAVHVSSGQVTSGISAQLVQGGGISGKVTRAGDVPLPDVAVTVFDARGIWAGDEETDPSGAYTISGLPPGSYTVRFDATGYNEGHDANYVAAWYRTESSARAAVAVDVGQITPNIGAQLETGGRIVGVVRGTGGTTIGGVRVSAYAVADGTLVVGEGGSGFGGGYAILGVPPGNYKIAFDPSMHNQIAGVDYLPEWYDNRPSFLLATSVPVVKDAAATVNAQLIRGGTNNPPVLSVSCNRTSLDEGQTVQCTLAATDVDDDRLTFSATGRPGGSAFEAAAGVFSWSPGYTESGSHTVTFTVTDSGTGSLSDSEAVTIAVANVNRAPELAAVGGRTVEEGRPLTLTLSATDPDDDQLTFSVANPPAGASFDPAARTFTWTPAYSQSGSYPAVRFTVSDGTAEDFEDVTITVTDHNPVLFSDRFTDGTRLGDKDWIRKSGLWSVDKLKRYASGSLSALNLSLVKSVVPTVNPVTAGRIEAKVFLTKIASPGGPDARLVFACLGTTKYRYVQFSPGKVVVGQVGSFGRVMSGWKKSKTLSAVKPAVWLAPRVDLLADGTVRVYLRGALVFSAKFPAAVGGGVGVGAMKAQSLFDDFKLSDAAAL